MSYFISTAVPAIACTQGLDSHSPVTNGDVLNVRLGETLIVKCKGDTTSIYSHFSVRDYPHRKDTIEANESSLSYTWYFVPMSDAPVEIWGFLRGESLEVKMLVQLNIRVHDLNLETATLNPCTPPEYTTATAGNTQSANVGENLGNGQQSTEASTTAEKYALYIFVGVLVILVVLLLILVFILAVKLRGKKGQKNETSIAEEAHVDEQSFDSTQNETLNVESEETVSAHNASMNPLT